MQLTDVEEHNAQHYCKKLNALRNAFKGQALEEMINDQRPADCKYASWAAIRRWIDRGEKHEKGPPLWSWDTLDRLTEQHLPHFEFGCPIR